MTDVDELINCYIDNAIAHGEATLIGNSKKANISHDLLMDAYEKILNCENDTSSKLCELLSHSNESVRLWSATHCLGFNEKKSKRVLKELRKKNDALGFSASIVLEEWEKGTL